MSGYLSGMKRGTASDFAKETGQSGIARSASVQFTYLPPTHLRRDAPQTRGLRAVLLDKAEPFPTVQMLPAMKGLFVCKFISFNSVLTFPG